MQGLSSACSECESAGAPRLVPSVPVPQEPLGTGRVTYLLCPALVRPLVLVVDAAEVGHDDRHGQGDDQHPAQRADGAKDLPSNRLGHHVTITAGQKQRGRPLLQTKSLVRFPEQRAGWALRLRALPCKGQFVVLPPRAEHGHPAPAGS